MLVVTANIHAGVDGYGRRTTALADVLALNADLVFLQELWRGSADDQVAALRAAGYEGTFQALSTCHRATGQPGGRGWQPRSALLTGDEGLFFDDRRALDERRRAQRDVSAGLESGSWGLGLFTRLPIETTEVVHLPNRPRDKTSRALIISLLRNETGPFYAVAVHGAHLSHGSLLQYRVVRQHVERLSREHPVIMAGDFNSWRPPLRVVLPGWASGVRKRTWPAWRPHSQIDHILLRGPWQREDGRSIRTASDHRALSVRLTLR